MITVEQLSKSFTTGSGRQRRVIHAVQGIDFEANDGCITGLLGANGAGKTTCLRMIAGLITPDNGTALVDQINMASHPTEGLRRLGMLSDSRGLYPRLSAAENILYYANLQGVPDNIARQRMNEWAGLFDFSNLLDRRTEGFSLGERMKTAMIRALIHDPKNIILDEPTNGLDIVAIRAFRRALQLLRERGHCIVISTHIMQEVERLCDDVVVIAHGRAVARGSIDAIKDQTGCVDFEDAFVKLAFDRSVS